MRSSSAGFTLLIAVLVAAIVVAIGLSILGVTFKQIKLTGIERESETAFQAANAGLECVRYHDLQNDSFDVGVSLASPTCFGSSGDNSESEGTDSGDKQNFSWTWGDANDICSDVSIYKFYDAADPVDVIVNGENIRTCPANTECTVIKARGYNNPCGSISTEGTVERELTAIY